MQPFGVIVADEHYGPTGAFRSSETCDVAAHIWSKLLLLTIGGDGVMADRIEQALFNAAPAMVARDGRTHVYFQSPNRMANRSLPPAGQCTYAPVHHPLCCSAALTRPLPYYVTHMWMATYDNGLAATLYGPCKVSALVADAVPVELTCRTDYPFNESIKVVVKPARETKFPLSFRMPNWCKKAVVAVNGADVAMAPDAKGFVRIERAWKSGDTVRLHFPMSVQVATGYDRNVNPPAPYAAVSYGPLLFALPIADTKDANTPDPAAKWNYALDAEGQALGADITVERGTMPAKWDWPLESPLKLRANAVSFDWKPEPAKALPSMPVVSDELPDKVALVPYGCTKFRVSMFPVTERVFKHFDPASVRSLNAAETPGAAAAPGQAAQAFGVSSILLPRDLLKDKCVTPEKECKGWGRWETPFVIANSDDDKADLLSGAISLLGRSVLVHPGAERDVAVGWKSPIAGKVSVRGKVVHAHPGGGDGVSWAVVHATKTGQKVLVRGTIDRAGSQTIPSAADAGKFAGVPVQKGDGVYLVVGPRGSHQCDSTVVELVVTESEGSVRVWNLAKDVAAEGGKPGAVRVRGGEFEDFKLAVGPGETFDVPPGFVGAYNGDADDAGNSLRKWLFGYSMPEIVRKDTTYPKVQWNAFQATGDKPNSWNSVEAKYYPMIDDIAPLGFEEVMLDVGWWKGGTSAPEPEGDPVDWSSGMAKAAEHAHKAGLRFCLYWNKGENMASPDGRNRRIAHIKRLYGEYNADMWRSGRVRWVRRNGSSTPPTAAMAAPSGPTRTRWR